jgi:hypothetical protein
MPALMRKAFDAVERPVASASERLLETDTYMDALAVAWKLRRRATRRVQAGTAAWLHLWGIPTRGDIAALAEQIARLERR